MTNVNRAGSGDITAIKTSDGSTVPPDDNGDCTLGVSTYVFPLGGPEAPVVGEVPLAAVHLRWDAVLVGTITIETTNFPAVKGGIQLGGSRADVVDHDTTAGSWIQENPSTAYVGVVGGTATNLTITVPGGSAGGATIHLGNLATQRCRVKAVVGTGGKLRCNSHGKGPA